jgi:hypothetical protein
MKIDSLVDGKEMLLDRKTQTFVPRIVVDGAKDTVTPNIEPFEIVLHLTEGGHLSPETVLEMSKKILGGLKAPAQAELSVGDLSVVKKKDRETRAKEARQYLRNREKGLTVGDLSKADEDRRGLSDLYAGPAIPEPSTSETQEMLMEMQRKQREKREEILHIQNLLVGGTDQRLEEYVEKYLKNKA